MSPLSLGKRIERRVVVAKYFGATFVAVFVLIYWLREFPLFAVPNRFELMCQFKVTVAIVIQNLSLFTCSV